MSSILKVDTIQDTDGNNIINESGNTITIGASGDTTNIIGTLQNDGAAVGGANTPYFQAVQSTDVGLTDNTAVLIPFNSDPFDSGSLFNTSNGRFVMDSTNAGKYFLYAKVSIDSDKTFTSSGNFMEIKLNHYNSSGSSLFDHSARNGFSIVYYPTAQVSGFFNLADGDYVTVTLKVTSSGLNAFGVNTTSPSKLEFTGFKIIE